MNDKRSVWGLLRRKGFKNFIALFGKFKYLYVIVILLQLAGTGAALLLAETSRRLFDGGTNLSDGELTQLLTGLVIFVCLGILFTKHCLMKQDDLQTFGRNKKLKSLCCK